MRFQRNSSFKHSLPISISHVDTIDELNPQCISSSHSETWSCAWSQTHFAWSCGNRIVQLIPWNKRCRKVIEFTFDCGNIVWSLAFGCATSDKKYRPWRRFVFTQDTILATGLQNGHIKLWDCRSGHLLMELIDHTNIIKDMHFSPDNSLHLASASYDGTVKLWDLNDDGNMYKTLRTNAKRVNTCCWSPDATMLACGGSYKTVALWDMKNKSLLRTLIGHHYDIVCCQFSSDGALLATASFDTRVIIWDPCTGDILSELYHMFPPPSPIFAGGANEHHVRSLSFSNCGDRNVLATVCDDGYLRFWDIFEPDEPLAIAETVNVVCCRYHPSDSVVATGSKNGRVVFYEAPSKVASLRHICRAAIRHLVSSHKVDHLSLPIRVKEFVKYKSQ